MPFSVSLCLTNTNSRPLGTTLQVFLNQTSSTNVGLPYTTVQTSSVIGGACPYTLPVQVPDDTTTIRLYDPITLCYSDIPVSNNNVCATCNLNFTSISNNQISAIYVGNLTGACDSTISNYRIGWYGPDSTTNLAFTSGFGTKWVYLVEHPITAVNSPILLPGRYVSKITEVELNEVYFSYTGGTGNVLSPTLISCSRSVGVTAYTCNNGTYPFPYSHLKTFVSKAPAAPQSLSTKFTLLANTSYFIWDFSAYTIYDTFKLDFYGSSYSTPINLENIQVGTGSGFDLNPNSFPKKIGLERFNKITTLTGLRVNDGDSLLITVTPNPTNNGTNWGIRFGCLSNQPPTKTCLDSYENRPYKIKKSSIYGSLGPCNTVEVSFDVSGCSESDNSLFFNNTLVKYGTERIPRSYVDTYGPENLRTINYGGNLTFGADELTLYTHSIFYTCTSTTGNRISVTKTNVGFLFVFSSINDRDAYLTSFTEMVTYIKNSGPPFVNNPTLIAYYKLIRLRIPTNVGAETCTDNVLYEDYDIHCNATYAPGVNSSGDYTLTINTPQIINMYTCPPNYCEGCYNIDSVVDDVNQTWNATFTIRTLTNGLRLTKPFWGGQYVQQVSATPVKEQVITGSVSFYYKYNANTYAASGATNPLTLIPSLSGSTWDWKNHFYESSNGFEQTVFDYKVIITSSSSAQPLTYQIWAKQIFLFQAIGSYTKVYDSVTGIFDSYFVY